MRAGLLVLLLSACSAIDSLVVDTKYGEVRGSARNGARVFLNVPFASAGRFQMPQPPAPWSDVRDATKFGPGCPQLCFLHSFTCPSSMSEDCLQLNVYAPLSSDSSSALPVILYLPGGDFFLGTAASAQFDAATWANASQVVIVTANYRLGALGLVQVGNEIPANLGMEDQRMAMRWVAANVAAFGGNGSRITLMGQSAGAASVAFHLLYSKGLFHAAISESNPMGVPMKSPAQARVEGDVFLRKAGCRDVACLQKLNVSEILDAQVEAQRHFRPLHPLLIFFPWSPVVEEQPILSLARGEGAAVPVLMGTVANETNYFAGLLPKGRIDEAEYLAIVAEVFPLHVAAILKRFPPELEGNVTLTTALLATEYLFSCANRLAFRGQKNSSVFVYAFDHPLSFGSEWWGPEHVLCWNYTCHSGELPLVFGSAPLMGFNLTGAENRLVSTFHIYWGNFAHTGNPSIGPFSVPFSWPANSAADDRYMRLDGSGAAVRTGYRSAVCDFFADKYD